MEMCQKDLTNLLQLDLYIVKYQYEICYSVFFYNKPAYFETVEINIFRKIAFLLFSCL